MLEFFIFYIGFFWSKIFIMDLNLLSQNFSTSSSQVNFLSTSLNYFNSITFIWSRTEVVKDKEKFLCGHKILDITFGCTLQNEKKKKK